MKKISITFAVMVLLLVFFSSCVEDTGCVGEGTLIATPNGAKLVERLQVGDIVLSPDPFTNQMHKGSVISILTSVRECLVVSLENGSILRVTPEHPLWDPLGLRFKPAGEFVASNILSYSNVQSRGISLARIVSIADQGVMSRVYDLTIDSKPHTFIANGVLVHNKLPPLGPGPSPVSDLTVELVDDTTARAIWTEPGTASENLSSAKFFLDTVAVIDSTLGNAMEILVDLMGAIGGSVDTAMLTGLEPATTYFVRMRVTFPRSASSELSNSVSFTTGP